MHVIKFMARLAKERARKGVLQMNYEKLRKDLLGRLSETGQTKKELADDIGMSASALGRFLAQQTDQMLLKNAESAAKVLGRTVSFYMGASLGGNGGSEGELLSPIERGRLLQRLNELVSDLSNERIEALISFIERFERMNQS